MSYLTKTPLSWNIKRKVCDKIIIELIIQVKEQSQNQEMLAKQGISAKYGI